MLNTARVQRTSITDLAILRGKRKTYQIRHSHRRYNKVKWQQTWWWLSSLVAVLQPFSTSHWLQQTQLQVRNKNVQFALTKGCPLMLCHYQNESHYDMNVNVIFVFRNQRHSRQFDRSEDIFGNNVHPTGQKWQWCRALLPIRFHNGVSFQNYSKCSWDGCFIYWRLPRLPHQSSRII